jgi:hypothetical protein
MAPVIVVRTEPALCQAQVIFLSMQHAFGMARGIAVSTRQYTNPSSMGWRDHSVGLVTAPNLDEA